MTQSKNNALIPPHAWGRIALLGVLFVVLHGYVLRLLYVAGTSDPDWSHILIVPFISLYLIYRQSPVLRQITPNRSFIGLAVFAVGMLGYGAGNHLSSTMIMGYSMVIELFGLVWFFVGGQMMRWLWLPVMFLLFGVRFTFLYTYLSLPLQHLASSIGAVAITLIGIPMSIEADSMGALIEVYHRGHLIDPALNVEEACSGLRSLMAMSAVAVALAFIDWRPWYSRLCIAGAAIPVAVGVNVARITITGLLYPFNPDLTRGAAHEMTGLVLLIPGLFILLFIAKTVDHWWGFKNYSDIRLDTTDNDE